MTLSPRPLLYAVVAVFALVPACGEDTPIPYALSWQFEDGLDCGELGIAKIQLTIEAARMTTRNFECTDGFAPDAVELGPFDPSLVVFTVEALSPDGVLLYTGDARVALRDEGGEPGGVVVLKRVR